jgi:uncharacterized protein
MPRTERGRDHIEAALAREIGGRPEIMFALLHGSFLDGGPYRDVDVAIWLDPLRTTAAQRFQYALDLSVDLSATLGCPIDVRALNDATLAFRYHALSGRPLIARDEDLLAELRARTWDEYFDFQPFARQFLRETLSG